MQAAEVKAMACELPAELKSPLRKPFLRFQPCCSRALLPGVSSFEVTHPRQCPGAGPEGQAVSVARPVSTRPVSRRRNAASSAAVTSTSYHPWSVGHATATHPPAATRTVRSRSP